MKPADSLYAALLAREFPAQTLLRLRTELRRRPCVVMQGEPPLQNVISANKIASAFGIEPGMTKVEVEAFPPVTMLRRSLEEERTAKAILLECAGNFSPRIEDVSQDGLFLCVLDISGTEKLFGPPGVLAKNLLSHVQALGMEASIAVSHNFHTAVAMAKGTSARNIRCIAKGDEANELSPLPLTVLELTEEQAGIFLLWGIRTLGELAHLPEKELVSRMGQAGKCLLQMARGEFPHLLQPLEPDFTLEESMQLDSPLELLDALLFVVNIMLEQLIFRATARVLALTSITMHLTLEGGTRHACIIRPVLPTNDRQLLLKLLHLELEAHPPSAAILAVALKADPGSTGKMQLGLFSTQMPEPSRLDVTLARIRALVGEGNVGRAVLKDTHCMDGCGMEAFCVPAGSRAVAERPLPARSAMRMLRPPEIAWVTLQSRRPKSFLFRDRCYAVKHAYGPWTASGEWWTATLWKAEQWDLVARTLDGQLLCCCIVRDLMREEWKMVALYD